MSLVVLDASAVLAVYFGEPGAETVRVALPAALLSGVNDTEVVGKAFDRKEPFDVALRKLAAMGMVVVPHDVRLARHAVALRSATRRYACRLRTAPGWRSPPKPRRPPSWPTASGPSPHWRRYPRSAGLDRRMPWGDAGYGAPIGH